MKTLALAAIILSSSIHVLGDHFGSRHYKNVLRAQVVCLYVMNFKMGCQLADIPLKPIFEGVRGGGGKTSKNLFILIIFARDALFGQ